MAELSAGGTGRSGEIREDYMAMVRRKRAYSGILLIVFVALMVSCFMLADSPSWAAYMLANSVSPPPLGGTVWIYRIVPIGGVSRQDWSVCHISLPDTDFEFSSKCSDRTAG